MNCQQHSQPIVRIVRATGKGLCQECISSNYINIEKERLRAERTLDQLCRQYEDQQRVLQEIRKRLQCGSTKKLEQQYSLPSLQASLQQRIEQKVRQFNVELQELINSYGQLQKNDPRLLELSKKMDEMKQQQKEVLKQELRNDVQRYITKSIFRG